MPAAAGDSPCAGCHLWWHHRPLEAGTWFEHNFPIRDTRLRLIGVSGHKLDREAIRLYLEQEREKLS